MLCHTDFTILDSSRLLDENFIHTFLPPVSLPYLPTLSYTDIDLFEADLIIDTYNPSAFTSYLTQLKNNPMIPTPKKTISISPLAFASNINNAMEQPFPNLLKIAYSNKAVSCPYLPPPNQGLNKLGYFIAYTAGEHQQSLTVKATNSLGRHVSLIFLEQALRIHISTPKIFTFGKPQTIASIFLNLLKDSNEITPQQKRYIFTKLKNRTTKQNPYLNSLLLSPISISSSDDEDNIILTVPLTPHRPLSPYTNQTSPNLRLSKGEMDHIASSPLENRPETSSACTAPPLRRKSPENDTVPSRIPLFMLLDQENII